MQPTMSSQHQHGNTDETLSSPKFPSPYIFHRRDPLTLVELRMRSLSGLIRQKPRWWEKVQDEALVAKWRAEMVELDRVACEREWRTRDMVDDEESGGNELQDGSWYGPPNNKRWPCKNVTDAQLDYVFAELRWVATQIDHNTGIHVSSETRTPHTSTVTIF